VTVNATIWLPLLAIGLGACTSSGVQRYQQLSPQERADQGKRVEVSPANLSTVQFKELGETARHRTLAGFIKKVWREDCDVASHTAFGYSPSGSSQWRVKCRNTPGRYDYVVAIPERASSPARVLQCYSQGARVTECSILGRPTSAGE
jgi:hypothetical protein